MYVKGRGLGTRLTNYFLSLIDLQILIVWSTECLKIYDIHPSKIHVDDNRNNPQRYWVYYHKRKRNAPKLLVREVWQGNVQPFCILSSHLGQWHHCALLLFYLYYLLITKLNKSLPVTMTMCLPKSIHLISKGLCGTSVLWSRLFDYSIGVFTENKNIIINTRWCSGPYKDTATL